MALGRQLGRADLPSFQEYIDALRQERNRAYARLAPLIATGVAATESGRPAEALPSIDTRQAEADRALINRYQDAHGLGANLGDAEGRRRELIERLTGRLSDAPIVG
jgi:hypothetical protein